MGKDKSPQHEYPRGVLYKNYDLYETEGVDGPAKQGPGAGFYQNMHKYKSVTDFLAKKRKRKKKMRRRKIALKALAIDFNLDQSVNTIPYETEPVSPIGIFDNINPEISDEEGHSVNKIYYGTKDSPDPIFYNSVGINDGNPKAINEEPEETKNNYYGILE